MVFLTLYENFIEMKKHGSFKMIMEIRVIALTNEFLDFLIFHIPEMEFARNKYRTSPSTYLSKL